MSTTRSAPPLTDPSSRSETLAPRRRVVDAPTRTFHWLFALTFSAAYLTGESERWQLVHVTLGYLLAGLLGFRLLYGVFGPRHARLGRWFGRVAAAPAWLRTLASARSPATPDWRQGANLAAAAVIVGIMALVAPLVLSGYGTYKEWGGTLGSDWLEEVHEWFGNALLAIVIAHVGLLAVLSLLRRQNQALSMLTGHVSGAGPDLVRRNRAWLAALIFLAVVAFGAWQWLDSPGGLLPDRDITAGLTVHKHEKVRGRRHDDDD